MSEKGRILQDPSRWSTPVRSEQLRRAIHGARLLLTSVERTQGLTAVTASALVLLASRLKLWCGRRRAAGLSPTMAHGGTAAAAAARTEGGGRGAGDRMEEGF